MNMKFVKIIGITTTVLGVACTLVGNWASEKQQDAKIAEKVAEALANATNKES